jgi:hypothetical protein
VIFSPARESHALNAHRKNKNDARSLLQSLVIMPFVRAVFVWVAMCRCEADLPAAKSCEMALCSVEEFSRDDACWTTPVRARRIAETLLSVLSCISAEKEEEEEENMSHLSGHHDFLGSRRRAPRYDGFRSGMSVFSTHTLYSWATD